MYNRSTSKERFDRKIFPAENLWAKELSNMNLVISGKNIDITEGLRSAVEEKLVNWRDILQIPQKCM